MQWSQSLRARGFTESDLGERIKEWKEQWQEKNGPFRSSERRYPPMPADIARGFDHQNSNKSSIIAAATSNLDRGISDYSIKPNMMNFDGPPPKNYVCNRCGLKGEILLLFGLYGNIMSQLVKHCNILVQRRETLLLTVL